MSKQNPTTTKFAPLDHVGKSHKYSKMFLPKMCVKKSN